jgi:hypothetical protein
MKALAQVLIGTLVRLLRGAAELLARWAAPSPQAPASPKGGELGRPDFSLFPPEAASGIAPPDWKRRAVPPPPAHWLAVVRARAPQFQPVDPRPPRDAAEGGPVSLVLRPLPIPGDPPVFFAAEPGPREASPRRDPSPRLRTPTSKMGQRPAARRVVTVVEEQPLRAKRAGGEDVPVRAAFLPPRESTPEAPSVVPPASESFPEPLKISDRRPERVEEVPAHREPTRKQRSPVMAESLPGDRESRLREPSPDCRDLRVEKTDPWSSLVLPAPRFLLRKEAPDPAREESQSRWPALLELRADRPIVLSRNLLREALFQEELGREQRGLPWSA